MYATGSITFVSHRTVSFFPLCSFFPSLRPGLCVGAYEWGASLRDVTRGTGSHGGRLGGGREGGPERGGVGGVGGWVDGETLGGVQGDT